MRSFPCRCSSSGDAAGPAHPPAGPAHPPGDAPCAAGVIGTLRAMQITPLDQDSSAAQRRLAADALVHIPSQLLELAELEAARFDSAGRTASRAQLLAPVLAAITPAAAAGAARQAITAAIALEPFLAPMRSSLDDAAAGLQRLLEHGARDTARGHAWTVYDELFSDVHRVAAPLYAGADVVDPSPMLR